MLANDGVSLMLIGFLGAVTTAADASHVEFGRAARGDRNATAACDRSSRGKSLPLVDGSLNGKLTRVSPTKSSLRLRLRVAFTLAGQAIQDQVDFSGFPPGLTGSV